MMPSYQATEFEKIRAACDGLQYFRNLDEQFSSLDAKIGPGFPGSSKNSGLDEISYPDLRSRGLNVHFFNAKKRFAIPQAVIDARRQSLNNVLSGIFPEVRRAWVTVDSDLYLWRYEDGEDLACFSSLTETIMGLGIVIPQPNAFKVRIPAILVAVTPAKINLFSLTCGSTNVKQDPYGVLHVTQDTLVTLPTDGVVYHVVHGTKNGRIFLGGRDGNLYEILYAKKQRWGANCSKVNHSSSALSYVSSFFAAGFLSRPDPITCIASDHTRNTLFVLTSKGSLTAYYLGEHGDALIKIGCLSEDSVTKAIVDASGSGAVERESVGTLVDVTAVESLESVSIHAIGTTTGGVRVYFSCAPDRVPYELRVAHVRLPPGFAANSGPQRPRNVHLSLSRRGLSLLAASQVSQWQENVDEVLWMLSSDLLAASYTISECFEVQPVKGAVRAVIEHPMDNLEDLCYDNKPLPCSYVLLQLLRGRVFVVLTDAEVIVVEALRPLDQLEYLLTCHGGEVDASAAVRAFFELVRPDQACVLGLALACGSKKHGKGALLAERAARAVLAFGCGGGSGGGADARQMQNTQMTRFASPGVQGMHHGPITSTPYPVMATPGPIGMVSMTSYPECKASYSSLHNALYTYVWRLCRPIIVNKITQETIVGDRVQLCSSINESEASYVIEELTSFLDFLRTKCDLLKGGTSGEIRGMTMNPNDSGFLQQLSQVSTPQTRPPPFNPYTTGFQSPMNVTGMPLHQFNVSEINNEIRRQEKASIDALDCMVDRMIQVLELWRILANHTFSNFMDNVDEGTRSFMRNAQFLDLVVNGQEPLTRLISVLINKYLSDCVGIEGICSNLRKVCPKVYREEDAKCAKTSELLSMARAQASKMERMRLVEEAMEICKDVALHVNMIEIGGELAACGAFGSLVMLSSAAGMQCDPGNLGVRYYRKPNGPDQPESIGRDLYFKRMEFFKVVTGALYDLLVQGKEIQPRSAAFSLLIARNSVMPSDMRQKWAETEAEAHQYADEMLDAVVKTDDELLHVSVFSFLVEEGLNSVLVELKSPYLEEFLRTLSKSTGSSRVVMDNLWRLHEREGSLVDAASVLIKMAEKHGGDLNLDERILYYGRALTCLKARVVSGDPKIAEWVSEVSDKLAVARIQKRVLLAMMDKAENAQQRAKYETELNQELFSAEDLYQAYVSPFNLWECQIAMIHCAELVDRDYIAGVWHRIIDEDLEKSVSLGPAGRVTQLRSKMERLYGDIGGKQDYFPVDFLVDHLETRNCELRLDEEDTGLQGWVWQLMESCGIEKFQLLDVYFELEKRRESKWNNMNRTHHLAKVLALLLLNVARNSVRCISRQAMELKLRALDISVSLYMDLTARSSRTAEIDAILRDLKNAQDLLEERA